MEPTPVKKRSAVDAGLPPASELLETALSTGMPSGPLGAKAMQRLTAADKIQRERLPAAVNPDFKLEYDMLRDYELWSKDDDTFDARLPGSEGMPFKELGYVEKLYARVAGGERGLASLYSILASKNVFTSGSIKDPQIWVVDHETALWKPVRYATWTGSFAYYLSPLCIEVLNHAKDALATAVMTGNKPEVFEWRSVITSLSAACSRINTLRTEQAIATKAYDFLLDEERFSSLDADKTLLSFTNGVLDLSARTFREREPNDLMSYALPYPFDPEADMTDVEHYFRQLWDTDDAVYAARNLFGYCLTGLTTEKMFHQIAAPSNSGKTMLFQVLSSAMGAYASQGVVPIGELSTTQFEGTLIETLVAKPPPRLIVVDEVDKDTSLKADLINRLSDGSADQFVTLRMKHKNNFKRVRNCAKYFLLTNYYMALSASATGLVYRARNIGLTHQFVDAPSKNGIDRAKDPALIAALSDTEAGKQAVMRWLVEGAFEYLDGGKITCGLFDASSFELSVRGDPYLAWVTETYFPTGSDAEHVVLAELVAQYKQDNRAPKTNAGAYEGIKYALATMLRYVTPVTFLYAGTPADGYVGLRRRRLDDVPWLDGVALASQARDEERTARTAAKEKETEDDSGAAADAEAAAAAEEVEASDPRPDTSPTSAPRNPTGFQTQSQGIQVRLPSRKP